MLSLVLRAAVHVDVYLTDFGKVASTDASDEGSAFSATANSKVKCKCAMNKNPEENGAWKKESDKFNQFKCKRKSRFVTYKSNAKFPSRSCSEPLWFFSKATAPKGEVAGKCEGIFRPEITPPEYESGYKVVCGGVETAAFDLYGLSRIVSCSGRLCP